MHLQSLPHAQPQEPRPQQFGPQVLPQKVVLMSLIRLLPPHALRLETNGSLVSTPADHMQDQAPIRVREGQDYLGPL